jgi:hypothetical protein
MLPGVVTDLDLDQTGRFAVAIVRSAVEARATEELGSAGLAGEGGFAGADGEPVGASGGAGGTGQQPQWTSVVAILPVPDIYADVTDFSTLSVPELVGSVVVPATGNNVLLFTNAIDSDRVTIMNTSTETWRVVELKAPVRALFASPDGEHAVGLLAPPQASSKAGAFSLVPVTRNLPPKLQGTEAATLGVVVSDNSAIITTRDSANGIYEAFLASLPGLSVDSVELPSAPTASGIIVDSNIGFIAQQHAEGRITFVGLEDVSVRTLTGFELGLKVIDGE